MGLKEALAVVAAGLPGPDEVGCGRDRTSGPSGLVASHPAGLPTSLDGDLDDAVAAA